MFSRPLEVQLWHKVTAEQRYAQPSHEELLGSFFLEMNELPKFQNRRFKSDTSLVCHEGYFSMYDFKNEKISHERLGCKLYLIPKRKFLTAKAQLLYRWQRVSIWTRPSLQHSCLRRWTRENPTPNIHETWSATKRLCRARRPDQLGFGIGQW